MKYIELIRLRTTGNYSEEIKRIFVETVDSKKIKNNHCHMRFFKNTLLNTDFLIVVICETDMIDLCGSRIGQQVCELLRSFGLVNHTVWTELEGEDHAQGQINHRGSI